MLSKSALVFFSTNIPHLCKPVSTCFREIVSWTSSNRLRLNPDKTEAIWFASPAGCSRIGSPALQLTGATIIPSQTVRSLGMYLDSSLTMGPHVGRVAAGCYAKLRVLKEAKPFVPHNIFISLIVQLILSKLDYCNSILVNASCRNLNTLQAVMNTAARLKWFMVVGLLTTSLLFSWISTGWEFRTESPSKSSF